MSQEFVDEYASSLKDLTFNSKPHITMMTMLAEENVQHAPQIVKVIEAHLQKVNANAKLPTLYLIDSIMKNVGQVYQSLFTQNIVSNFCTVFEKVDEKVRGQMYKLRQTWSDIFPNKKLYAIDVRVKEMDPAWPILAQPPQQIGIHINPRFLKKEKANKVEEKSEPPVEESNLPKKNQEVEEEEMRKQLLAKQQELLKIQRKKLELDLLQAQVMVEEQKRQLILREQQLRVQQGPSAADVQKSLTLQQLQNALVSALDQQKMKQAKANQLSAAQGVNAQQLAAVPGGPMTLPNNALPTLISNNKSVDLNTIAKKGFPIVGVAKPEQASPSAGVLNQAQTGAAQKPGLGALAGLPSFKKVSPHKNAEAKDPGKGTPPKVSPKKSAEKSPKKKEGKKTAASPKKKSSKHADAKAKDEPEHRARKETKDPKSSKPVSGDKDLRGRSKSTSISPSKSKIASQGRKARRSRSRSPPGRGDKGRERDERSAKRGRRSPWREKENESRMSPSVSKDVDLRTPPSGSLKRESRGELADPISLGSKPGGVGEPPFKKSKTGDAELDEIFGGKDQDYRQLDQPVPKLSPIREHQGWAQYKASRPDEFKNPLRARDPADNREAFGFGKQDHDWRTSPSGTRGGFQPWQNRDPRMSGSGRDPRMHRMDPRMRNFGNSRPQTSHFYQATQESDPAIPRALMFDRGEKIMRQADAQLRAGMLTVDQHREIMEQLAKLYELQRMRLVQREQRMNETFKMRRPVPDDVDIITISPDSSPRRDEKHDEEESRPVQDTDIRDRTRPAPGIDEGRSARDTDIRDRMRPAVTGTDENMDIRDKTRPPEKVERRKDDDDSSDKNLLPSGERLGKDVSTVRSKSQSPTAERHNEDVALPDKTQLLEKRLAEEVKTMDEVQPSEAKDEEKVARMFPEDEGKQAKSDEEPAETSASNDDPRRPKSIKFKIKTMDSLAKEKDMKLMDLQPMLDPNKPRPGFPPAAPVHPPKSAPINTVMIDDKPREVRFFGDTGVVLLDNNDPREIAFRGPPQEVVVGKQVFRLSFLDKRREFMIDGYCCNMRFGAPTREIIIDEEPYSAIFGGPPFLAIINGKKYDVRLCGPTPEVYFGDKPRFDLLPEIMATMRQEGDDCAPRVPPAGREREPPERPGPGWVTSTIGRDYDPRDWKHSNRDSPPVPFARAPGREEWRPSRFSEEPPFRQDRDRHFREERRPRGDFREFEPWNRRGEPVRDDFRPGGRGPLPPTLRNERGPMGLRGSPDEFYEREARNSPYRDSPPRQAPFFPDNRFPHGPPPPQQGMPPMNPANRFDGPHNSPGMMNIPPRGPPPGMPPRFGGPYGYPPPNAHRPMSGFPRGNFGYPPNSQNIMPQEVPQQRFHPPPMPVLPPQMNVNELFEKLVAKGIIPNVTSNSENKDVDEDSADAPSSEVPKLPPAEKLPLVELNSDSLKTKRPMVISHLYCGIQCSSCGIRFTAEQTDKYAQHLDWHFRQNRREKDSARKALSRKWYFDVQDWVQFEEIEDLEERARSFFEIQATEEQAEAGDDVPPSVPAGENEEDKNCVVCHERFELYWDEDHEEWHFRDAVRHEEKNYHPLCFEDFKEQQLKEAAMEESAAEEPQEDKEAKDKVELPADKVVSGIEQQLKEVTVKEEVKEESEEPMDTDVAVKIEGVEVKTEEPMDVQETLEVFNVLSSRFTVPPGIGLDIEDTQPEEEKQSEVAPPEEKPSEVAPPEEKPSEVAPPEEKPSEVAPSEEKPSDEALSEEKPSDEAPPEEKHSEVTPPEEKPSEVTPPEEKPSEVTPPEEKPSEVTPPEEKPSEIVPPEEESEVLQADAKSSETTDDVPVVEAMDTTDGLEKSLEESSEEPETKDLEKVSVEEPEKPASSEAQEELSRSETGESEVSGNVTEDVPVPDSEAHAADELDVQTELPQSDPVEQEVEREPVLDVPTEQLGSGDVDVTMESSVDAPAEPLEDSSADAPTSDLLDSVADPDTEATTHAEANTDDEQEMTSDQGTTAATDPEPEVADAPESAPGPETTADAIPEATTATAPEAMAGPEDGSPPVATEAEVPMDSEPDPETQSKTIDSIKPIVEPSVEVCAEGGAATPPPDVSGEGESIKLEPVEHDESELLHVGGDRKVATEGDESLIDDFVTAAREVPVFRIENISRIPVLVSSGGFPAVFTVQREPDEDVSLKESSDIVSEFAFEHPVSPQPPPREEAAMEPQTDGRFRILPPVNRGTELSGLCSIM